jgi:hypothetical protein
MGWKGRRPSEVILPGQARLRRDEGREGVCPGWIYAAERENRPTRRLGTASSGYMRRKRLSPIGGWRAQSRTPGDFGWGHLGGPGGQSATGMGGVAGGEPPAEGGSGGRACVASI